MNEHTIALSLSLCSSVWVFFFKVSLFFLSCLVLHENFVFSLSLSASLEEGRVPCLWRCGTLHATKFFFVHEQVRDKKKHKNTAVPPSLGQCLHPVRASCSWCMSTSALQKTPRGQSTRTFLVPLGVMGLQEASKLHCVPCEHGRLVLLFRGDQEAHPVALLHTELEGMQPVLSGRQD